MTRKISERLKVGQKKVQAALKELEHQKKIFRRDIPNPGKGRDFVGWAQTPEPET